MLIKAGADVNLQNKFKKTALMYASDMGKKDIVDMLIKAGADVNLQNMDEVNALMYASIRNNSIIIDTLIKAGADIDHQNNDGYTALMYASKLGHFKVVEQLLSANANIELENNQGDTALKLAKRHEGIIEMFHKHATIKQREEAGPAPACRSRNQCTNDNDLFESPVRDIEEEKFVDIRSSTGKVYCYDIDQLTQFLATSRKNQHPYDKLPIWANKNEFDKIISHRKISEDNKRLLIGIFYPQGLSDELINTIRNNYEIFDRIGLVGFILLNDYTLDFSPSNVALDFLAKSINELPEKYRDSFFEMRDFTTNELLRDTIDRAIGCIHGVASKLIRIFLGNWSELPKNERRPLPPIYTQLPLKRAFAYSIIDRDDEYKNIIQLYIHDDDTHGINSIQGWSYIFNVQINELHYYNHRRIVPEDIRPAIETNIQSLIRNIINGTNIIKNYISDNNLNFVQGIEDINLKGDRSMKSLILTRKDPFTVRFPLNQEIQFIIDQNHLIRPNAYCSETGKLLHKIIARGESIYMTTILRQVIMSARDSNLKKIKCGKSIIYDVNSVSDYYYRSIAKNIYNDVDNFIENIRNGNYKKYYPFFENFYEQFLLPNYSFMLEYLDWMNFYVYNSIQSGDTLAINEISNYGAIMAIIEIIKPWGTLKNQKQAFDRDIYEKIYDMMVKIYTDKRIDDIRKYHHNMKLMYACFWGDTELLTQILDIGIADINVLMGGKIAPIHITGIIDNKNNLNIVRILLGRGANINLTTNIGQNALITSSRNMFSQMIDIIKFLIEAGINVNQKDIWGNTLLHHISVFPESETDGIIKALIKAGANINEKNGNGETPLHAVDIHTTHLEILIKNGADINAIGNSHETFLHDIVVSGYFVADIKRIVMFLMENGIDPTIRNDINKTALQMAIEFHVDAQIIEILQNYTNNETDVETSIINRATKDGSIKIVTSANRIIEVSKTATDVFNISIHENKTDIKGLLFKGEKIRRLSKQ